VGEVTDLRVPGIALDRPLEAEVRFLEASAPGEKIGQEGVEVGVTRVGENPLAQNVDRARAMPLEGEETRGLAHLLGVGGALRETLRQDEAFLAPRARRSE